MRLRESSQLAAHDALKRAQDETGQAKIFSANITADDHYEMLARADFILETFGPDADKVAFLVDGYVGGPGMVTTARRQYPGQYLHYHRAGHGAVTSPQSKRGYTAYVLAIGAGWTVAGFGVQPLLEQARPPGILAEVHGVLMPHLTHPNEHNSHLKEFHVPSTWVAISTALSGFVLAAVFYGFRLLDAKEVANQFKVVYRFLWNKWYFDELYNVIFVQPTFFAARRVAEFDRKVIDGIINGLALGTRMLARVDDLIDRYFVDGLVNLMAAWIFDTAIWSRGLETGRLRQYVMFIIVGTVALFIVITLYLDLVFAGF